MFETLVTGSTNQIELSRERLMGVTLPVLPLDQQHHIANFLDAETSRIDRMVNLQLQVRARLLERNGALVDDALQALGDRYGLVSMRRVIRAIEQGSSPQCDAAPAEPGEWGVLKLSSVKRGRFNGSENKRLPEGVRPVRKYCVRGGDLLVTRANTPELVGDSAVVDCDYGSRLLLPDLIYRLTLTNEYDSRFASMVINASRVRGLIEATARGSSQSMVKLRCEDIRQWTVPLAPLSEQRSLVHRVDEQRSLLDRLLCAIDRQVTLLAERKQALITATVTGQLDVTTARSGVRV